MTADSIPWIIAAGAVFALWPLVRWRLTRYNARDHRRAYLKHYRRQHP